MQWCRGNHTCLTFFSPAFVHNDCISREKEADPLATTPNCLIISNSQAATVPMGWQTSLLNCARLLGSALLSSCHDQDDEHFQLQNHPDLTVGCNKLPAAKARSPAIFDVLSRGCWVTCIPNRTTTRYYQDTQLTKLDASNSFGQPQVHRHNPTN